MNIRFLPLLAAALLASCTILHGHGISIGSNVDRIKNLTVRNVSAAITLNSHYEGTTVAGSRVSPWAP